MVGLSECYGIYIEKIQDSSYKWTIGTSYLYAPSTANKNIVFGAPCWKSGYKYLRADVEVASGINGAYNTSSIGIRYCKNGIQPNAYNPSNVRILFTDYSTKTNYDGTSEWYKLDRQIVQLDLAAVDNEPFFIAVHNCDCEVKIYAIWLE